MTTTPLFKTMMPPHLEEYADPTATLAWKWLRTQ